MLILTVVVTNGTDMPLVKQDDLALASHTSVEVDGAEPAGQLPSGDYRSFHLHYRIPVGSTIRASWITSDGLTAVFGGLAPAEDSRTTTPGHNGSAEPPPLTSSVDAIASNSASAAVRSSTISRAMISGAGRLSRSSSASFLSQVMSRLALSRAVSSPLVNDFHRSDSTGLPHAPGQYEETKSSRSLRRKKLPRSVRVVCRETVEAGDPELF